jgi:23S rRNA pseudouridine955/2504/2580 synthase
VQSRQKNKVQLLQIDADQSGQRIDNFLMTLLKGVPKSRIYRLLRKGEVRVNKGRIRPAYRLVEDDVVRVPPVHMATRQQPVPGRSLRELLTESILYEDRGCLVLNKPSGLAVHGGSGINLGVIEAIRQIRPGDKRLELVHRLDRDTSGCLLLARDRSALVALHEQLRLGVVKKKYLALVKGYWPGDLREVNAPLLKQTLTSGERMVRADKAGKHALTRFKVVKRYSDATLLAAELDTGRTHQIRVHCLLAGCPIAGDTKYGEEVFNKSLKAVGLKRLFLHANELLFYSVPEATEIKVSAPLPIELQQVLDTR